MHGPAEARIARQTLRATGAEVCVRKLGVPPDVWRPRELQGEWARTSKDRRGERGLGCTSGLDRVNFDASYLLREPLQLPRLRRALLRVVVED